MLAGAKRFAKRFAIATAVIGGFSLANFLTSLRVPTNSVIEIDFGKLIIARKENSFDLDGVQPVHFHELLRAIEHAAKDPAIIGIIAKLDGLSLHLSEVEELREVIEEFNSANKFTYAHCEDYIGSATAFYLSTAFKKSYSGPLALVHTAPTYMSSPYLRNFIQKLGFDFEVIKRKEFKGLYDNLVESGSTPQTREANFAILKSAFDSITCDIAKSRHYDVETLAPILSKGMITIEEAIQSKLIDGTSYWKDIKQRYQPSIQKLKQKAAGTLQDATKEDSSHSDYKVAVAADFKDTESPEDTNCIALSRYIKADTNREKLRTLTALLSSSSPKVAIVNIDGVMMPTMANSLVRVLQRVNDRKDIKSVVIRINSGGGAVGSADILWREIRRLKDSGKHIVVSMGTMCASGGVYVAAQADKIVANKTTLTGSIGVVVGRPVIEKMLKKLNINMEYMQIDQSTIPSLADITRPMTPKLRTLIDDHVQSVYDRFVAIVADGRKWPIERAESIAGGKVFTGIQAHHLGLVDEIGGFRKAIKLATNEVLDKHPTARIVPVVVFKETWLEQLQAMKGEASAHYQAFKLITGIIGRAQTLSGKGADARMEFEDSFDD